jgi:hypothetical protein
LLQKKYAILSLQLIHYFRIRIEKNMSLSLKINALSLFFLIFLGGCLEVQNPYSKLAPGVWRATLELVPHEPKVTERKSVQRVTDDTRDGFLPFNFEVQYTSDDQFYVEIVNGTERIRCDSIRWWRTRDSGFDSLQISFPHYQSYIKAAVRERIMDGEFVVTSKENYRIPFHANHGITYRFTNMNTPPTADLSGKWETNFGIDGEKIEKAVGEFSQKNNNFTGTFRTETGDYRFLDGTVQGEKFWLSAFDGAHAFLFSGKITGDSITGEFRSGTHHKELWSARRNENFDIRQANALTKLKNGATGIHFAYQTPDGKSVKMPDPACKLWAPGARIASTRRNFWSIISKKIRPTMSKSSASLGNGFATQKRPTSRSRDIKI